MKVDIVTSKDLEDFKSSLLEEIKNLLSKENAAPKYLRSAEVLEYLRISTTTLRTLITDEVLKPFKIRGTLYFKLKDIESLFSNSN